MDDADPFSEDQAEKQYLLSKPNCFLITGKPGSGKATLTKRFARAWKCIEVSVPDAIQFGINECTELGLKAKEFLSNGEAVPESICMALINEMITSPQVQHHGYVLHGLPFVTDDVSLIEKQIEFIKNLAMKPDYIINLRIPDDDLVERRKGLKVDPVTNKLYTKDFYEKVDQLVGDEMKGMEEVEEEQEDEMGEEEEDMIAEEEIDEEEEPVEDMEGEERTNHWMSRLVVRNDEFEESIKTSLRNYKEKVLERLEDYIAEHDQLKVHELDANLPPSTVFKNLMNVLQTSLLMRVPVPMGLQGLDDSEEVAEDTDTEDMLRTLAASEMISPGFRWRRSRWGRFCPVALYNGSRKMGSPQFAVSFLDKMYLMSSQEGFTSFMRNPRKFLLPPQPAPPCKIVVLGGSLSGKTTLCERLKERYKATVFDMKELMKPRTATFYEKIREENYSDLLAKSIVKVKKMKEEEEKLKRKQSLDEEEEDEEEEGDSDEEKSDQEEAKTKDDQPAPPPEIEIDENHPLVQAQVEEGMKGLETAKLVIPTAEYIDCLEDALTKMYENTEKGPSTGGWIFDNFPQNKDQLNMLVERGIIPDDVIVFREESTAKNILINRWNELHREGKSITDLSVQEQDDLNTFKDGLSKFDHEWTAMQGSMRNVHNIEPMIVPCQLDVEETFSFVVKKIEAAFQYLPWEYTGMDQDEEEEDLAALLEEDDVNDEEEDSNKKKPLGETVHFCPVMLKEELVLVPGSQDCAVKYRERVYFLSSQEAREKFLEDPETYLPQEKPLQVPPVRLLLLGPKGSGKTLHGRLLAQKFGVFHISFKDRLQELILHKTQKKIGPDFEFPEDKDVEEVKDNYLGLEEEQAEPDEVEVPLELSPFEENIRNNILEGEALMKETLDEIFPAWWREEPFKSRGFILEGFPRTSEEAKYLADSGLYPDGAIYLAVEDVDICNRLMPPKLERWKKQQQRIQEAKEKRKNEKLKQREQERARRKAEKIEEIEERKAEKLSALQTSGEEDEDDTGIDEDIDIDELVDMEMLEEFGDIEDEDEGEEETEEEAVERIKNELVENYEDQVSSLENVQESLQDLNIPLIEIEAGRKPHITQYLLLKTLKVQVNHRENLFNRCQSITGPLAKKLLNQGYKLPSRFGRWCPVKLFDGDVLPPFAPTNRSTYPIIFRRHIYFLSNEEAKERFMQAPFMFINQDSPKPIVPIKIAIMGSPKSGKTTLAKRFADEYGLVRLSVGEALRKIMKSHAHTKLVKEIKEHLTNGYTVPDELAIQALEVCLLEPQCVSRGFVLDGYPVTAKQMELLRERSIIPYKVIDLVIPDQAIMQRGLKDRKSRDRSKYLHDSHTILAIRIACHRRESAPIREFYKEQHKNLLSLDAEKSIWWVYNAAKTEVEQSVSHIQNYIQKTSTNHAAPVKYMCISPKEVQHKLGEFGEYCPVYLAKGELVDCSHDTSNDLLAEYRGKLYKFASEEHMDIFISSPSQFLYPLAPNKLPNKESLPRKRSASYLKKVFPMQIELKGYCPVTYKDGNSRYEAIIPGDQNLIVEYKKKLFCFASEDHLNKFMRLPKKYSSLTLPQKLPPKREPISLSSLPMLGYMEQTVAAAVIKALTAVGNLKPKFPFLSAKRSAVLYVAYHLKAHNPNSKEYVREKYKKKLQTFEEQCELITYLSKIMKRKYLEQEDRPIDFNHKLESFVSLQQLPSC